MKLSHSKLKTILECPMSYYLKHIQGIQLKVKKSALSIGSQVHWCIENDTEDLTPYFEENGTFKQRDKFTRDELLSEARPNFNELIDPKCDWAVRHLELFPVEINKADYYTLLPENCEVIRDKTLRMDGTLV